MLVIEMRAVNAELEDTAPARWFDFGYWDRAFYACLSGSKTIWTIGHANFETFSYPHLEGIAGRAILLRLSKHGQQVGISENRYQSHPQLQGRSRA